MNAFINSILSSFNNTNPVSSEIVAYTWFGRPNYAYSESAQKYWIGVTQDTVSGTTQFVYQYDIVTDTYTATQVGTVYQKDDHNQTQLLIRQSDGRLLSFYNEHNGAAIRYRISTNPYDSTEWGDEIDLNPLSGYSYVSPYQADNGDIFIFFRTKPETTATWYYMKSTDGGATFGSAVEFYQNGATQCYVITNQNANEVHFISTNGHPQHLNEGAIGVYHFYFDMATEMFYKSDGTSLTLPITITDIFNVFSPIAPDTSWILDVSFKNNLPRILYTLYPRGMVKTWLNKELWFIEWNGSAWVNNKKIAHTLTGYIETDTEVGEYCYGDASRFDTSNPDIIWMPMQVNGILEIHKVDVSVLPAYIEQLTFNSTVNNWRPISVPSKVNNLLWLQNNNYTSYSDYSITLLKKTEVAE